MCNPKQDTNAPEGGQMQSGLGVLSLGGFSLFGDLKAAYVPPRRGRVSDLLQRECGSRIGQVGQEYVVSPIGGDPCDRANVARPAVRTQAKNGESTLADLV